MSKQTICDNCGEILLNDIYSDIHQKDFCSKECLNIFINDEVKEALDYRESCPRCYGTGTQNSDPYGGGSDSCNYCGGRGKI
jgi:DnaJ-class molecular chaperone